MNNARLLFIHALSPLHAGTGQGVGVIDLPIAREKATNLPYLPGSSLKGPLREACPAESRTKIFGPETANASDHAGSAQFSDQRLLLLPVRSLAGTFAWVTSPIILARFARDAADAGQTNLPALAPLRPATPESCIVASASAAITLPGATGRQVILEDLDLNATADPAAGQWATWLGSCIFAHDPDWQAMLADRLCIVHDDVLAFLLTTATEVIARVRLLPDTKTVAQGGLWYEEALPAVSILAGLLVATPIKATVAEVFAVIGGLTGGTMQLGGKATVGRGLCRTQLV
ncbi:type III-B CRISPR module RAMP protein Cmr4 [Oscillochloris sp. ZM17-4]|uniref:type III-B CRISPR module RAMP protein Cmr4 n=1 Tax=Oscillochloris sp. ZM17-4 TaxID=2866714 RepID=UPI001C72F46E|nr:type III-B CRISPR module RAMP protein Cmr4 [Oscillochloris sp. ZM17-4]MBX0331287.1 type III-B CRISPR module RAMP protein Cmr4 [Oscillochloris sp. ZM17-4]